MKKAVCALCGIFLLFMSCSKKNDNPFFSKFGTPFETPAFDKIKNEHYLPAFKAGIEQDSLEIAAIANNPDAPTFENTLEALDRTGVLLSKVSGVYYNVLEANTNDTLQQISNEVAPLLSKHSDDMLLNEKLFQRVKTVYDQRESLTLTPEQQTLLERAASVLKRVEVVLLGKEEKDLKQLADTLMKQTYARQKDFKEIEKLTRKTEEVLTKKQKLPAGIAR